MTKKPTTTRDVIFLVLACASLGVVLYWYMRLYPL
jgi:hypothetical protein